LSAFREPVESGGHVVAQFLCSLQRSFNPDNLHLAGRDLPKIRAFALQRWKAALAVLKVGTTRGYSWSDEVDTFWDGPSWNYSYRALAHRRGERTDHVRHSQALLGHASPDTVMIYAKLYPSQLIEEYRKTVRSLYNAYYSEDGLKNPTTEEWAAFTASCNLRNSTSQLCAGGRTSSPAPGPR
jgi:hypothetical protein